MTPLAKRLPRELRRNIGKYLGIFLLMCGSIALTSGFLLAAHSIGCLIDDMRDAYTIEDGRVTTSFEATDDQLRAAEDAADDVGGVTFYKNFSIDAIIKKTAGDDGTKRTLRTYAHRTKVDIASYCEGRQPKADDEVAIDRVFATNNDLAVGDKVELEGRTYTICGIMTQPDSQALFLNNSDFTVNTITYGVAEVTDAGFAALEDAGGAPAYTYSFTFADRDLSAADRIDAERALPADVEWPRFEDGGLVRIGDELEFEGKTMLVGDAIFYADGWALWCDREDMNGRLYGKYGERVKRPAPEVLDADGVPIKVGDTVWATYNGCKHIVMAVCSDGSLHPEMVTDDGCMVEYEEGLWDFAKKVTHEQPDSWILWGEDLDMAVKAGEVDKVEMMRRAKALAKAASEAWGGVE